MNTSLIVISDLDGTLLDHHDYSYSAAIPALELLANYEIPLILNSSKTASEIREIRLTLNNHHPYVVENGAGIFLPDADIDRCIKFGTPRDDLLILLNNIRQQNGFQFTGFNDLNVEELTSISGLSREQAQLAMQRDFTEPLIWRDAESSKIKFIQLLEQEGLTATQGGRFLSISGKVDKGQALNWLKNYYLEQNGKQPYIIALGDSENDKDMLEASDQPVLIRSPVNELPIINKDNLIIKEQAGPEGWNN
ncbi:MAG: HAD-IIB family hydrolase, partial [Pseudomonadota bacterium]